MRGETGVLQSPVSPGLTETPLPAGFHANPELHGIFLQPILVDRAQPPSPSRIAGGIRKSKSAPLSACVTVSRKSFR